MHGLIFETSVWLLAESTRLLSMNPSLGKPLQLRSPLPWGEKLVSRTATSTKKPTILLPVGVSNKKPHLVSSESNFLSDSKKYLTWFLTSCGTCSRHQWLYQQQRHIGPANQYTQSSWPAQYSSVAMCNTKTNSLGKEIKSTFTDTATVNQLPQSGIGWDTTLVTQFNPQHDRCKTILTDWNLRLKHARWLPAYSSAARPMLDRLDWFVGKLTTEMVNSAPFCQASSSSWVLIWFVLFLSFGQSQVQ
jgi:hypothetical protein